MIVTEEEPDQKLKSGTPPDIATSFATAGEATIATKLDSVVESAKEESSTDAQVDIVWFFSFFIRFSCNLSFRLSTTFLLKNLQLNMVWISMKIILQKVLA